MTAEEVEIMKAMNTNQQDNNGNRYQGVVAEMGELALTTPNPDAVMREVINTVVSTLKVDYCEFLELLPDDECMLLSAGLRSPAERCVSTLMAEAGPQTLSGFTLLHEQTAITEDFRTDVHFRPTTRHQDNYIISGITMLVHNSAPYGVIGAYTTVRRHFTPEEIDFLQSMANILSEVIERRELEAALRMSEDKYRTLFEESLDVIFFSTATGEFIDINQAGVRLFEYDSKEEMLEMNIEQDLYLDPAGRKVYHQILNENGAVKDFELRLKTKCGRTVIVQETSTAVRDSKGNIIAYRGIMRNITRLREAQEQLHGLFVQINTCCEKIRPITSRMERLRRFLGNVESAAREGIQLTRRLLANVYIPA